MTRSGPIRAWPQSREARHDPPDRGARARIRVSVPPRHLSGIRRGGILDRTPVDPTSGQNVGARGGRAVFASRRRGACARPSGCGSSGRLGSRRNEQRLGRARRGARRREGGRSASRPSSRRGGGGGPLARRCRACATLPYRGRRRNRRATRGSSRRRRWPIEEVTRRAGGRLARSWRWRRRRRARRRSSGASRAIGRCEHGRRDRRRQRFGGRRRRRLRRRGQGRSTRRQRRAERDHEEKDPNQATIETEAGEG